MGHEDFTSKTAVESSSDRAFGVVFAVVFALVGLYPLLGGDPVRWWAMAAAAAFAALAMAAPRALAPLNRVWMRVGAVLHAIVSPIVLAVMFYLLVAPIGLLWRVLGKDPLRLRFEPRAASYWIERRPPGPEPETFTNQF
jgi:hypothetical protein